MFGTSHSPREASNLIVRDSNGTYDVFVRDRLAESTRTLSVGATGQQANGFSFEPAISADGRYVAFGSGASKLVTNMGRS
jgi:hypothetical protein